MAEARDALLAKMAAHVLTAGLNDATLRPLARAAGTSDRMLIYRFGSKEGLIGALLDHLAAQMTVLLDAAALPPATTPQALAAELAGLMRSPALRPYAALWLEIVAGAARGVPGYGAAAERILAHFHGWLMQRLPPATPAPAATAARVLALIEGALVLSAAGPSGAGLAALALGPPGAADD